MRRSCTEFRANDRSASRTVDLGTEMNSRVEKGNCKNVQWSRDIYSIILPCGSRWEVPCIARRDLPYEVAGLWTRANQGSYTLHPTLWRTDCCVTGWTLFPSSRHLPWNMGRSVFRILITKPYSKGHIWIENASDHHGLAIVYCCSHKAVYGWL